MNRRDILKPPSKTKAKQKLEVVTEPEIEEDKVFKHSVPPSHSVPPRGETKSALADARGETKSALADAVPVETPFEAPVETPFEAPAKKTRRPKQMTEEGKKRMLEASARGRKTAAENRSRRAKERKLEKEKVLEEHGGEKGLKEFQRYQQLKEKYERQLSTDVRLPSVEEVDEVEDIEETPTARTPFPPAGRETPYKNVGSAQLPNSAQNVIDYERLITGISERFERQFLTDKQVRQKQHEADRAEVDTYKDKFTSLQRKQTMDTLSNNRVFQRTHSIKDQFRGRAARGWYRR